MKIIVDHRERGSGIIEELHKHELEVDVQELKIADYVIQGKNPDGKIQSVGIEEKLRTIS